MKRPCFSGVALDAAALDQILGQHEAWVASNGKIGCQADLNGIDLRDADLSCVDLRRASLVGTNLSNADLIGARLIGANMIGARLDNADLRGANLADANLSCTTLVGADLRNADLSDTILDGTDLSGADLRGADLTGADLCGTDFTRAKMCGVLGFPIEADAPQRLLAVARAALADDSALDMQTWHRCETTHCIAGWAIHLAGEQGQELEESYGPEVAGRMLLGHEAAMRFHDGDSEARVWLQSVLDAAEPDQSAPAANSWAIENKPESTLDAAALAQILKQHKAWVASNGREGCQADLSGANLLGADLSGARLREADLSCADLRDADLVGADLSGADLSNANLRCAVLKRANLLAANLSSADLRFAELDSADLGGAELSGALLNSAYLTGADLTGAHLIGADLTDTKLVSANLSYSNLHNSRLAGADLKRANLRYSNLSDALLIEADLSGADLQDANLCRVNLFRASLHEALNFPIVADAPQRLLAVARAALADDSSLYMGQWHRCETTHCVAGWAIHQAGEKGRELEDKYGSPVAGRMLLGHEAASHFYDYDRKARLWLQSVLDAAEPDQSAPAANS